MKKFYEVYKEKQKKFEERWEVKTKDGKKVFKRK